MKAYYHGDKQKAWEATRTLFVSRITKGIVPIPQAPVTTFPAQSVALHAKLPVSYHLTSQVAAFDELRKEFERVWEEQ